MASLSVYQDMTVGGRSDVPVVIQDGLVVDSVRAGGRPARVVGDRARTVTRAMVRWYRAGQLGADEARRVARATGARC